jgi:hypothetical protein
LSDQWGHQRGLRATVWERQRFPKAIALLFDKSIHVTDALDKQVDPAVAPIRLILQELRPKVGELILPRVQLLHLTESMLGDFDHCYYFVNEPEKDGV